MHEEKLIQLLKLQKVTCRDNEITASCPFAKIRHTNGRDNNPSFSLNIAKGVFNCFSCGAKGTIEELVSFVLDISISEAMDILVELEYDRLAIEMSALSKEPNQYDEIIIPEGILSSFTLVDPQVEIYRGVIDDKECMIFPVRNHYGLLVGGIARSVTGRFHKNLWHFHKKKYLYGEHQITYDKPIILVEGPGDRNALTKCGIMNVVALMGAHISEEQADKLVSWTNELIVWLDNDNAGYDGTIKVHKLLDYRIHVRYVNIPNLTVKDPREFCEKYGSEQTHQILNEAKTWLEWMALTMIGE